MDSLTQIVLGSAVGEAVLGKKIGNKAIFYGAISGTIPDLDVMVSFFTDTVTALSIHRGFTHSVVFAVLFAPVFGYLVSRYERFKDVKAWSWLFFWGFITHSLLDVHTTWGTQLFWPFDLRLALQTIFVIDPLYTLPFLVCLILVMIQKRTSPKRQRYNKLGLLISTSYLVLTFLLKWISYKEFESLLKGQGVKYSQIDTRPSLANIILWNANVETDTAYLLANYSFFDSKPITFYPYPKNHHLLGSFADDEHVKRMISISKGWYTINKKDGKLYFNDLRFGVMSLELNAQNFVFSYEIVTDDLGNVEFKEVPKDREGSKKLFSQLWGRVKGN